MGDIGFFNLPELKKGLKLGGGIPEDFDLPPWKLNEDKIETSLTKVKINKILDHSVKIQRATYEHEVKKNTVCHISTLSFH